jgi:hypothetical protein
MTYDYTIRKSTLDGAIEVSSDGFLVARLYRQAVLAAFLAGASALGKSVYDRDAGHGLTGTLDQVMHEETKA